MVEAFLVSFRRLEQCHRRLEEDVESQPLQHQPPHRPGRSMQEGDQEARPAQQRRPPPCRGCLLACVPLGAAPSGPELSLPPLLAFHLVQASRRALGVDWGRA